MNVGFGTNEIAFQRLIGWELYQVTLDKYHVMFWFENEHALLNVASKFSFRSKDGSVDYTYMVYGLKKKIELDRILRVAITRVSVPSPDKLDLLFANGDVLSIHDDPTFRSWWFMEWERDNVVPPNRNVIWEIGSTSGD